MMQFMSYSLMVGELESKMAIKAISSAIPKVLTSFDKSFKTMVEFRTDHQERKRKESEMKENLRSKNNSQSPIRSPNKKN